MRVCLDLRSGTGCNFENRGSARICSNCGRTLQYALEVHDPGTIVGSYRIVNKLGHGSFGAVYTAEDLKRPPLLVALKETLDPDSIRTFRGEFAVLQRLRHEGLPIYYEMFEHPQNGYLVMELVPGQSLEEILDRRQGPLPEQQVLGYAVQLCGVLTYLHSQRPPIIHRDIKPANIRLTPDGQIKLVDFGLVKEGDNKTRSSRLGLTPAYAPLEQYGGGSSSTDARSDLYSLGATLYHLLSGKDKEPPPATLRVSASADPLQSLTSVNPSVSPQISAAVMRAMALRADERFGTSVELLQGLLGATQARSNQPGLGAAPPPSVPRPTIRSSPPPPPPSVRPASPPPPPPPPSQRSSTRTEHSATARPAQIPRRFGQSPSVFVSYVTADQSFGRSLVQLLKAQKVQVRHMDDLRPGAERDAAFKEEVAGCTHLIPIISPQSQRKNDLDWQLQLVAQRSVTILPVIIGEAQLPLDIQRLEPVVFPRVGDERALAKVMTGLGGTYKRPGAIKRGCVWPVSLVLLGVFITLCILIMLINGMAS